MKHTKPHLKTLFAQAYLQKTAIPGFNFDSLEIAKAIALAAEELQKPILLMVTESAAKSMGINHATAIVQNLVQTNDYLYGHWDHGFDFQLALKAVDAGFDSVMYDGSRNIDKINFSQSQTFVQYAKSKNVWTECEIGKIGGKEDQHQFDDDDEYTSVKEAIDFYQYVQCDMLAVALGTLHGFYQKPVKINFSNIQKISQQIQPGFLVLHGCTGVSKQDIQKAIACGITKLNFGTVLKKVAIDTMRTYLNQHPDLNDLKPMHQLIIQNVKNKVKEIILWCY